MAGKALDLSSNRSVPPLFGRGLARVNEIGSLLDVSSIRAFNTLRIASNIADDETITVNGIIFEFDVINTSLGNVGNSGGANFASGALTLTITAHGQSVGNLIRIGSEMMRVGAVTDANTVVILASGRGACGTTAAAHSGTPAVLGSDDPTETIGHGHYPIGVVTTLTPVAVQPIIAGTINDHPWPYNARNTFCAASVDTGAPSGTYGVMVIASQLGKVRWACSETMAGSGNVWDASTFHGGSDPVVKRVHAGAHVVSGEDVTNGQFTLPVDFFPKHQLWQLQRPSTGSETTLTTWDGTVTNTAPGNLEFSVASTGVTPTGGTYDIHILIGGVEYIASAVAYGASASTMATDILAATRAGTQAMSADFPNGTVTGTLGALPASAALLAFAGFNTDDIIMYIDGTNLTPAGGVYKTTYPDSNGSIPGVPNLLVFTKGSSHPYVAGDIFTYILGE